MATIRNTVKTPDTGRPVAGANVRIELVASTTQPPAPGWVGASGLSIIWHRDLVTDALGAWSADVEPNTAILPAGTVYRITETPRGGSPFAYTVSVPAAAGPHWVGDILTPAPSNLPPAMAASGVSFTPTGTIAADTTQAAIVEVATEAATALAAEAGTRAGADTALLSLLGTEAGIRAGADALLIPLAQKGAASGVATLGADSKIPGAQLPELAINETFVVASEAAMLALTAQRGDMAVRTDISQTFVLSADAPTVLGNWVALETPGGTTAAISVHNLSGAAHPGTYVLDNGAVTGLTYNSAGQITAYTEGGVAHTLVYDTAGRLSTVTANAVTRTVSYSASGQIAGVA